MDLNIYSRETEYFNSTPIQLLDEFCQIITSVCKESTGENNLSIKKFLQSCPILTESQVEIGRTTWQELFEKSLEKAYDLFESYVTRNILILPKSFPISTDPPNPPPSHLMNLNHLQEEEKKETIPVETTENNVEIDLTTVLEELNRVKMESLRLQTLEKTLLKEGSFIDLLEKEANLFDSVVKSSLLDNQMSLLIDQMNTLKTIVADNLEMSRRTFSLDDQLDKTLSLHNESTVLDRLMRSNTSSSTLIDTAREVEACERIANINAFKIK